MARIEYHIIKTEVGDTKIISGEAIPELFKEFLRQEGIVNWALIRETPHPTFPGRREYQQVVSLSQEDLFVTKETQNEFDRKKRRKAGSSRSN